MYGEFVCGRKIWTKAVKGEQKRSRRISAPLNTKANLISWTAQGIICGLQSMPSFIYMIPCFWRGCCIQGHSMYENTKDGIDAEKR